MVSANQIFAGRDVSVSNAACMNPPSCMMSLVDEKTSPRSTDINYSGRIDAFLQINEPRLLDGPVSHVMLTKM